MKEKNVLYEIRTLENLIIRNLLLDSELNLKKLPEPTLTQMQIMKYILEHKEDVYQRDLEKVLNLRRATVSGVLQTMEKHGLIIKVVNENDARSKKVILSQNAKKLFSLKKKKLKEIEKKVIDNISKEDLDIFLKIICQMKSNLKCN